MQQQASFLSEAVIEKRGSSANLVHQVSRSSFDSRETTNVVTRSWLKPVIVNAGTQSRAQPMTGKYCDMQSAIAVKQQCGRALASFEVVEPDTLDSAAMTSVRLLDRSHAPSAARSTTTPGIGNLIWEPSLFWPTRGLGRPTPRLCGPT